MSETRELSSASITLRRRQMAKPRHSASRKSSTTVQFWCGEADGDRPAPGVDLAATLEGLNREASNTIPGWSMPNARRSDRVRKKPLNGLSERDLVAAMEAAGKTVSLETIAAWRRCGLLPRLSARSLGLHKGKTFYWAESDAFERASLIYDLFEAGASRHEIYRSLWLCGFDIALPQLRRSWLHKANAEVQHCNTVHCESKRLRSDNVVDVSICPSTAADDVRSSLLDLVLRLNAALDCQPQSEIDALIAAFESLRYFSSVSMESAPLNRDVIVALVRATWSRLRIGHMIVESTLDELLEARAYTSVALRFFHRMAQDGFSDRTMRWRGWPVVEARAFGTPLFVLTLALLKSGHRPLIAEMIGRVVARETDERPSSNQ